MKMTKAIKAMAVVLGFLGLHAYAYGDEFRAGFGVENSTCGKGEWNATTSWDRDSDDLRGHFNLGVGPNGSCAGQGYTIDVVAEYQHELAAIGNGNWFLVAGAGYDERTLPFEYLPPAEMSYGSKHFRGVSVKNVSAHFGLGYDFGKNKYIQVVYDVVENAKGSGGNLFPVSLVASWQVGDTVELNATTNFEISEASATWDLGPIALTGTVANGFYKADNPAPLCLGMDGTEYDSAMMCTMGTAMRAGAPKTTYNIRAEWNF